MSQPTTEYFEHDGRRLAFTQLGEGPRVIVLLHGLLLSKRMHTGLGRSLADRGYRVVSLDLLGHGDSDRPATMSSYSMQLYAEQSVALLDHLGVERAAFLGTSLGANTVLEIAALAPERVQGMIVEMPVLDSAIVAAGVAFLPVMVAMRFAAPLFNVTSALARRVPAQRLGALGQTWDWATDPPASSLAVLQGLFFGRIAPPKSVRRTLTPKALVIGHSGDPVHPFSDSDELVRELPDARLLQADSIVEMRLRPQRLTGEIAGFLDECFAAPGRKAAPRVRKVASRAKRAAA